MTTSQRIAEKFANASMLEKIEMIEEFDTYGHQDDNWLEMRSFLEWADGRPDRLLRGVHEVLREWLWERAQKMLNQQNADAKVYGDNT